MIIVSVAVAAEIERKQIIDLQRPIVKPQIVFERRTAHPEGFFLLLLLGFQLLHRGFDLGAALAQSALRARKSLVTILPEAGAVHRNQKTGVAVLGTEPLDVACIGAK